MKTAFVLLLVLTSTVAGAQTRPGAKPRTKPAASAPAARKPSAPPASPKAATERTPPAAPAPTPPTSAPAVPSGVLFRKGTTMLNLGLGLGYGYGFGSSLKSTPGVSLSGEKGVLEGIGPGVIGVGGLIGYKGYHYDYAGTDYRARWNNVLVLVRGTYHYDLLQNNKLDTYAGVSVGLRIETYKDTYNGLPSGRYVSTSGGSRAVSGIFIGARYFFTDTVGAFAEAGYDMSYLKIGLAASF